MHIAVNLSIILWNEQLFKVTEYLNFRPYVMGANSS